ncbi:hypothetical protein DPMN_193372 [Dreissena polymorpha]|uniref:Uncharacterized protein n=1 Tax=Dreissena polymorpha TaxID=45954 RepID=A0A9D3Y5M6_DREPO|nr:hypothetical protein DPMN_193372 [Dreissena polymorpha]
MMPPATAPVVRMHRDPGRRAHRNRTHLAGSRHGALLILRCALPITDSTQRSGAKYPVRSPRYPVIATRCRIPLGRRISYYSRCVKSYTVGTSGGHVPAGVFPAR